VTRRYTAAEVAAEAGCPEDRVRWLSEIGLLTPDADGKVTDFNKRNTTVSAGLAYSQDDIDPVGGARIPAYIRGRGSSRGSGSG
jgi:hypothetical protein